MSFPSYHRNARLEQRVRALLSQLRLLSEAESTSVVHFQKHSAKASSKAPKGAFRGRGPDPDESLLVWFMWRLEKVQGQGETAIKVLCAEAETRLERRLRKQPGRIAGAMYEGEKESAADRDKRIGEQYVGLNPDETSVIESEYGGFVSPANVRLVRLRAKLNPEDGRPMPEVPDTYDERVKLAAELVHFGYGLEAVGERLRCSKDTVARMLDKAGVERPSRAA